MPSFTQVVANLAVAGPLVEVVVGPSALFSQVMAKKGLPIPSPVKAMAMIDTGASSTIVTPSVIRALGLSPVGLGELVSPLATVPATAPQYNIGIGFPGGMVVGSAIAVEAPIPAQAIQVLIGRDILSRGVLTYIGYLDQFTLSF